MMVGQSLKRGNAMTDQFPRSAALPSQSSKFWAKEKDRYLRQLLISDIEQQTGRPAVIYFAPSEPILHSDADDISEIIEGLPGSRASAKLPKIDIILHTPGGVVDAVEKLISVLQQRTDEYRVIVPNVAKSGGTVIALSASEIIFGINSELGPIDPQMDLVGIGVVPCEFVAADEQIPGTVRQIAATNVKRMRALAHRCLAEGMLKGKEIHLDDVIQKLSSPTTYGSHGAVIDFSEAQTLGLNVQWLEPNDDLWRRIWLLHCLYEFDTAARAVGKITEGSRFSLARRKTNQQ